MDTAGEGGEVKEIGGERGLEMVGNIDACGGVEEKDVCVDLR